MEEQRLRKIIREEIKNYLPGFNRIRKVEGLPREFIVVEEPSSENSTLGDILYKTDWPGFTEIQRGTSGSEPFIFGVYSLDNSEQAKRDAESLLENRNYRG